MAYRTFIVDLSDFGTGVGTLRNVPGDWPVHFGDVVTLTDGSTTELDGEVIEVNGTNAVVRIHWSRRVERTDE